MKCIPDSVDTFQIAVSRGRVPNLPVVRALQLLGYPVRTFIEGQLPKLDAVGSSPISRSIFNNLAAPKKSALFCTTLTAFTKPSSSALAPPSGQARVFNFFRGGGLLFDVALRVLI